MHACMHAWMFAVNPFRLSFLSLSINGRGLPFNQDSSQPRWGGLVGVCMSDLLPSLHFTLIVSILFRSSCLRLHCFFFFFFLHGFLPTRSFFVPFSTCLLFRRFPFVSFRSTRPKQKQLGGLPAWVDQLSSSPSLDDVPLFYDPPFLTLEGSTNSGCW